MGDTEDQLHAIDDNEALFDITNGLATQFSMR
jgi:hypothetical protein